MKLKQITGSLFDRHQAENMQALAKDLQAILDYNVMMGVLEDPMAYEDEDEEENGDE